MQNSEPHNGPLGSQTGALPESLWSFEKWSSTWVSRSPLSDLREISNITGALRTWLQHLWTEGCLRLKEWDIYIHLSSYRWYRWQVSWLLQLNQLLLGLPTPDLSYLHRCHPGWEDTADDSHCYSGRFLFGLSSVKRLKSNLVRTIVNHSPNHHK